MRRLRDQRGQTAVFVVFLLPALLGIGALAIDVGFWYAQKRNVQNAADAAALAGAARLPNGMPAAQSAAQATYAVNGTGTDSVTVAFPRADTVSVTARRPATVFLAGVVGIGPVVVEGRAEASVRSFARIENDYDLLPWGVMRQSFVPGQSYAIYMDSSSANNGALALPTVNGSGCSSTGSASDYRDTIQGADVACPVSIGDVLPTKSGTMAGPTRQGLDQRTGGTFQPISSIVQFEPDGGATILNENSPQLVKLAIVESLSGSTTWPGGSGSVRVVGFGYFVISGTNSNASEVYGVFIRAQVPPTAGTTTAWDGTSTMFTVQLTR